MPNCSFLRYPILVLYSLCLLCFSYGQEQPDELHHDEYVYQGHPLPLGMDFEFGFAVPTKKEISNLYPVGLHLELGPKVGFLPSQRLWIKPLGGLRWLPQNVEGMGEGVMQHFLTWHTGLELQYQFQHRNLFYYPLLRMNYNWSRNFESVTTDTGSDYSDTSYSDTFISGRGFSTELGMRFQVRTGYIKLSYTIYRPNLHLGQSVINDDHRAGYTGIQAQRLNFNTINIGLGYDLFIQ